jgi:hypothetical protein
VLRRHHEPENLPWEWEQEPAALPGFAFGTNSGTLVSLVGFGLFGLSLFLPWFTGDHHAGVFALLEWAGLAIVSIDVLFPLAACQV